MIELTKYNKCSKIHRNTQTYIRKNTDNDEQAAKLYHVSEIMSKTINNNNTQNKQIEREREKQMTAMTVYDKTIAPWITR